MRERRNCEFFLIRYVPDAVRNEFVNIGVILRESGASAGRPVLRFTRDWSRVRCVDPDADIPMLEALEGELQARLNEVGQALETKPILDVIEDSFSNNLQVTDAKACLAESVIAEVESLMRVYVEPRKRERAGTRRGRSSLHASMRTHFERARVWELMQKRIPAAMYTRAGDPLRLDCGYRPNGVIKMFHAVSLESDVESAKVLAFSAPLLREGVARVENAELLLTAIVEPIAQLRSSHEDEDLVTQYRFGVETMEAQGIRVMTSNDLARLADAAQTELRVI